MSKKKHNEVAVGLTVFVTLILTIYIVVTLADWSALVTKQKEITVKLPYKTGLKGLGKGSPIHLGGVKIGNISNAGIFKSEAMPDDSNEVFVFFTMKIPAQYPLRTDCRLTPQSNVLGGQVMLSIEDLGPAGELLGDGQVTALKFPGTFMGALKDEFDAQNPKSLLGRVKSELTRENEDSIMAHFKSSAAKLDKSMTAISELLPPSLQKMDATLGTAHAAVKQVKTVVEDERIGKIVGDLRGTWQAELKPKGTLIGRLPECDIVLNSSDVSRKHARIFQDPFRRWIIEDLGSSNGICINNVRVETCAVIPGETIWLGSISLCIDQPLAQKVAQEEAAGAAAFTLDDSDAHILLERTRVSGVLSQHYLKDLNEINEVFATLTELSSLYPTACRFMSQVGNTVAAILRVPADSVLQPGKPEMLACRFGDDPDNLKEHDTTNLHLSRRVLESVRASGRTVMAKSTRSAEVDIQLTVQDVHNPRTVICASLGPASDTMDLLYIDTPSEHMSADTFEFVQAVAQQIALIRKNLFFVQAKSESEIINHQLSLAREIQARMIPGELKSAFAVDVAVSYEPAMWVGGDYYDVWSLENGALAFVVGDVSGKGLPAAMIMTNLQAALRTTMNFCTELPSVLRHVNRHLCENLRDDMFVTLFLALFDVRENTLKYINAGHLEPVIKPCAGPARFLDGARNIPLGIVDQPFEMAEETMPAETALLVVTDGVSETFAPGGEEYGTKRLIGLLDHSDVRSAEAVVQRVSDEISSFRESLAQHDDTTIFALVNTPPS